MGINLPVDNPPARSDTGDMGHLLPLACFTTAARVDEVTRPSDDQLRSMFVDMVSARTQAGRLWNLQRPGHV